MLQHGPGARSFPMELSSPFLPKGIIAYADTNYKIPKIKIKFKRILENLEMYSICENLTKKSACRGGDQSGPEENEL